MEEKKEVLKTAYEYIDNLKSGIENLVNKINSGEENNGMKLISSVADGIEWLLNVINLTKDLHKGSISARNTNDVLAEMIEAFENEDHVLVSDLFQYEFLPILESIKGDIRKVILSQ